MTIDLSFTQNPEWIEHRKQLWNKIKVSYSEEYTRKQREQFQIYFMTGTPPKRREDFFYTTYISLFPLQTNEGIEYCYKNYFKPEDWGGREKTNIATQILICSREDLTLEQKKEQFLLYLGERFNPDSTLPFLVGSETEYRPLNPNPNELLLHLMLAVSDWLSRTNEADECCMEIYLLDYLFSLFKYQKPGYLSHIIQDEPSRDLPHEISYPIGRAIYTCKSLRDLMRLLTTRRVGAASEEERQQKLALASTLYNFFEGITAPEYPQELIEHWRWVKRRSVVFRVDFESQSEEYKCFESIVYEFSRYGNKELSDIDRFKNIVNKRNARALVMLNKILSEWGYDERFFVEDCDYLEDCTYFLIFSCVDTSFKDSVHEFFELCNVKNLGITTL